MGAPWLAAGISFAVSTISSLAAYYLSTKEIEGSRLNSTAAPTSTYGQDIPTVYGKSKMGGNLIWTRKIREEVIEGNKKKGVPTEYNYYGSFAVLLCYGYVDVLKIWLNGKLVYDIYSPSGETQSASSKFGDYMKIYNGTADQQPDPTIQAVEGADRTPAFKGKAYIVFNDLPLKEFSNGIPSVLAEVRQSENPLLSDIVKDICTKAGIALSDIDVSELSDKVTGFVMPNNGNSFTDSLNELAKYYLFYVTQDKTGKLLFRKIQRPIVNCSIPFTDLSTRDFGNELEPSYKKIRVQDSELPTSLSINFKNPNLRYNPDTQIVLTNKGEDTNSVSFDFNLSLYRTEARYTGLILLNQFWVRRNRYEEINLPPKYLNSILPGDLISISLNEVSNVLVQVESIDIGANYQLSLKCVEYEGSSFNPPPVEVDEEIRYDFISDPSAYGSADLYLVDIPIFDDRDKESGFYAVASSPVPNWKDGIILLSLNDGQSYQKWEKILRPSAVGIVSEALPERRTDVIDYASQLTVTVENSNSVYQLFSIPFVDFLNGEIIALIGEELIAFQNAELIAPKTYKLSTFIRGMFGTPTSHVANEKFILLKGNTAANPIFLSLKSFWKSQLKVKLQTPGQKTDLLQSTDYFYDYNLYSPYNPFNIKNSIINVSLEIRWFRRTNFISENGGYDFYYELWNQNNQKIIEGYVPITNISITFEELLLKFPNQNSFIFKVQERNTFKSSEWIEKVIPLNPPYLGDEEGNNISDENNNLIFY